MAEQKLSVKWPEIEKELDNLRALPKYADRLDAGALHWMAGFWFKSAAKPIWEGGPEHLRDFQLLAGLTALDLAIK